MAGAGAASAPPSSQGLLEQQLRSSAMQFADLPDMQTSSRAGTPALAANATSSGPVAARLAADAAAPSGAGGRQGDGGGGGNKGSAPPPPRLSPSASMVPSPPQRSPPSSSSGSQAAKATGSPQAVPTAGPETPPPSPSSATGGAGDGGGGALPSSPPSPPQMVVDGAAATTPLVPGAATPIPSLPPGTSPDGDTRLCSPSGGPVLGVELVGKRAFQRSGLPVPHPASLMLNPSQLPPDGVEVYATPEGRTVCRIMRGCRLANGTAVLPRWMARHAARLDKDCGVASAIFSLADVVKVEPDGAVRASSLFSARPRMDVNTKWADSDLFGLTETRTHFPHALSDILPRMVAVGVLFGGGGSRELREHLRPPGAPAAARGVPALGFPALRPALAVHPDTMARNDSDWTKSFSHLLEHPLLRFEVVALSAAEHPPTMLGNPTGTGVCFRSFVTTNAPPYAYNSPLLNNPVLAASGVSHIDRFVLSRARAGPCTLRVTVVNRRGPRALLGLPALRKALAGRAAAARVHLAYRVVEFEGLPLCAQAAIMQTTDVVISAHGAGNTNYIFLRPASVALEIFPFGYRAGPFDGFARALRLDYGEFFAAPQTRVFRECARRTNVSREIVSEWDAAVAAAARAPAAAQHALRLEDGRYSTTARVCARMQELAFDVDAVAATAIDRGVLQCSTR